MQVGAVLCHRGRVPLPAGMNEAWRTFCRHGTKFIEHYECRGTNLIGAANLSPVTKLGEGTGAVSRYKLSRSQIIVKVQDFNWVQMRVSWCNGHYEFVLGAGAKAKSVTNNLPLLSVLGGRSNIISSCKIVDVTLSGSSSVCLLFVFSVLVS
jgi:hypothetical protein